MSVTTPQPFPWRRLSWLAGLPVVAFVAAASIFVAEPVLDDALEGAAAPILRESAEAGAEPWLRIDIHGRDLIALGEATDAQRRSDALGRLAAIPGLRRLVDRTGLVEDVSPFVFKVSLGEDGRIALEGNRPAETGAAALAAHLAPALAPGAILADHARAARGAPPGFLAAATYAVERLRGLKPGAAVTLTDTMIAVDGEAASPAVYEEARTALAAPPQGFSLGTVVLQAPLIADFRFGIARRPDGSLALAGNVVSEAARAEIRAAAATVSEGAPVEDGMQTARGLPEAIDPAALARFATALAGLLHEGGVTYRQGAISVSGTAIDGQAIGEIEAKLREARPAGLAAGTVTLDARPVSPYKLRIAREADTVTLSGHLPSAALRDSLLALLRPRFFHESIVDRTRLAEGAPNGLDIVLKTAAPALATLASGTVEVVDSEVRIAGESLYPETARRLAASLPAAMPVGWAVATAIGPQEQGERRDAQACARLFTDAVKARPIRFAPGSSELKPGAYPVLDALAALAKTCPGQRIEVVGHADPSGTPAPQAKPLPEYTASIKPAEKPKAAKKDAKDAKDAKSKTAKAAAKPEPAAPPPEPPVDIARQRALAIVEYLRQAGVGTDQAVAAEAPPLPEPQGVGLSLRS